MSTELLGQAWLLNQEFLDCSAKEFLTAYPSKFNCLRSGLSGLALRAKTANIDYLVKLKSKKSKK
jgi:hypothetical protein